MGQAAVWAALIVMLEVASQDADKLLASDDEQLVQALPTHRGHPPFGDRVGVGVCTGVRMISVPIERHTSSNALVNLASRSRIRKLHIAA